MPDSDFDIIDKRFKNCVKTSAHVERLWDQGRWCEGPAYFPAHRYVIWSDIPNDRIMKLDEASGHVSVFRQGKDQYTNGHTVDREGRLVSCEQGGRCISRTEHDGSITILADRFEGKRLNSPNDATVKSDGSIWFTDPSYGIDSDYEGYEAEAELDGDHVYRIDPKTGNCTKVANDFVRPNGLAFSPDESKLYIADTGATHFDSGPQHIRVFDVSENGTLSAGEVFVTSTSGLHDGFRFDTAGRLWTSAAEGVHCYDPDGSLIGKVFVPEVVANVCFGGPKRNRLFIAGTTSLYSVMLPVTGVKTF